MVAAVVLDEKMGVKCRGQHQLRQPLLKALAPVPQLMRHVDAYRSYNDGCAQGQSNNFPALKRCSGDRFQKQKNKYVQNGQVEVKQQVEEKSLGLLFLFFRCQVLRAAAQQLFPNRYEHKSHDNRGK